MSEREIILHIGSGRAGSTAMQQFLSENAHQLFDEFGILYPKAGRPPTTYANRHGQHLLCGFLRGKDIWGQPDPWPALLREIENTPARRILMSAEGFFQLTQSALDRLTELVPPWPLRVLAWVRDPADSIRSRYAHNIVKKSSNTARFGDFVAHATPTCHYRSVRDLWQRAFPHAEVEFRVYEYARQNGGLIRDLLDRSGIDHAAFPEVSGIWTNSSCSNQTISAVRALNVAIERIRPGKLSRKLKDAKRRIVREDLGLRFPLNLLFRDFQYSGWEESLHDSLVAAGEVPRLSAESGPLLP